eukprot:6590934-Lingulodinium_polyedra.AAC.1
MEWMADRDAQAEDLRTGVLALWQEFPKQPQWHGPANAIQVSSTLLAQGTMAFLATRDAMANQLAA